MKAIYLMLFLSVLKGIAAGGSHDYCTVTPQAGFNPELIQGRWYGIKMTLPSYLYKLPITDDTWDITLNYKTGCLTMMTGARYDYYPYKCANYKATMMPFNVPGTYRRVAPEVIMQADMIITDTDYKNYMIVYGNLPKFHKGCEKIAVVYGRKPYYGDAKYMHFIDNIISQKLCLDPKDMRYFDHSLKGYGVCNENRKY